MGFLKFLSKIRFPLCLCTFALLLFKILGDCFFEFSCIFGEFANAL